VGTPGGDIVAISSTGIVRSALYTGGAVRSSAAMDVDGNAVIGGGDGVLYGLKVGSAVVPPDASVDDAGLGPYPPAKIVFSIAIAPTASSPDIGADGTIYIGTLDGKLVAIASKGAATKWSVATNDTSGSSPSLGQDGTIYVGSSDHKLYAVGADGAPKWALDLGAEIKSSPAVGGDGTVYIGTVDGKLHAVAASGTERWAYATGGAITGTPAVYAGSVYVGSEDRKLHAVSTIDGAKRWTYETLGAVATPVIGPDGTVYVGSADARFYAITKAGGLLFVVNVKGKVRSAPAIIAGPTLFLTTDNGVVAIGP
jgi:outer membrane protein assembly factor BamB